VPIGSYDTRELLLIIQEGAGTQEQWNVLNNMHQMANDCGIAFHIIQYP
jgi:hypothetical protein